MDLFSFLYQWKSSGFNRVFAKWIFFLSVDFSMDFLESGEIILNPWIEYQWIAVYFIDPGSMNEILIQVMTY